MGIIWSRVTAVVVLATLGLGACGDDEDRLTKASFLEQGNAICKAGNERTDKVFEETFESEADFEDEAKVAKVKAALDTDIERQLDELGELSPPESLEEDFDQLIDDAEAALGKFRDLSPQEAFEQEEDPFEEVNQRAEELGLTECGGDEDEESQGEKEAAPGHTVVEVAALEYKFELGSTTLKAGPTAFHLVNKGKETHELSFAKVAEGHTLQEALEFDGDPEEAGLITDPSASTGHVGPGEDIFLNVDLEPGSYGMVCFIEGADGKPHAFQGMVAEFTVE
jgi:uncharacterized cupredoxin-like copper-binding protein